MNMLVGVCGFYWDLKGGKKIYLEVDKVKMINYFDVFILWR